MSLESEANQKGRRPTSLPVGAVMQPYHAVAIAVAVVCRDHHTPCFVTTHLMVSRCYRCQTFKTMIWSVLGGIQLVLVDLHGAGMSMTKATLDRIIIADRVDGGGGEGGNGGAGREGLVLQLLAADGDLES